MRTRVALLLCAALLYLCAAPLYLCAAPLQAAGLVSRPEVRRALDYLKTHHAEHFQKQIEIAQVPASPYEEQKRGAFLLKEFQRLGLENPAIDPKGNVLGWRKGASSRTLVIAAHLDTVFPPGTDFTVKRNGNRYTGPGLSDDSRGLAALLALVESLNDAGIKTQRSLLFVADVGEEGLGNLRGVKYLFEESPDRDRFDAFISIDGTDESRIANSEIGSRRYRVNVTGPGGHSWGNYGRVNPASAIGRIIAGLAAMEVPTKPRTTINVGRIGGGTSVNSIPFESWFEFDMRSEDEDTLIQTEKRFLDIVRQGVDAENRQHAASGTKLNHDAQRVGLRHAVSGSINAGLVKSAQEAARMLDITPTLSPGSTDSNAVASVGKPAITLGGGGRSGNAHSLEEWYEPENAWRGVQMLLLTVLGFDEAAK